MSSQLCAACGILFDSPFCPQCGTCRQQDQLSQLNSRSFANAPSSITETTTKPVTVAVWAVAIGAISFLILLIVSASNHPELKKYDPASATAVSGLLPTASPAKAADQTAASATPKPAVNEAKRAKRLTELKGHFIESVDEFNHVVTIRHRVFSKYMNGNGTALVAEIVGSSILMESQFVSDDWIFHESYTIKVGDQQISGSGRINHEVVSGQGICETVSSGPEDSALIAAYISQAGHQSVRVRLDGKYYKDYTLRSNYQKAIAETYEYFTLLHASS